MYRLSQSVNIARDTPSADRENHIQPSGVWPLTPISGLHSSWTITRAIDDVHRKVRE